MQLLECERCGHVFPYQRWQCPECKSRSVEPVSDHGRLRYAHHVLEDALYWFGAIKGNCEGDSVPLVKAKARFDLLGGVIDDAIAVYDAAVLAKERANAR